MSHMYTHALAEHMKGNIDLDGDDIRSMLVMTNTTADTEKTKTTIDGFTTLDEFDGSGYTRQTLTGKVVVKNTVNNRGEFSMDNITFGPIDAGTRDIAAVLIYKHVTDDTDAIPLFYINTGAGLAPPITATGGQLIIEAAAQGLVQES